MGLGKTVQTISLLAHLLERKNNSGPHIVVVPSTSMFREGKKRDKRKKERDRERKERREGDGDMNVKRFADREMRINF